MTLDPSIALTIEDPSQAGEARRIASAMAGRSGFGEEDRGKAALVVTEAATNLVKHAGGGQLILRGLQAGARAGLEVLALDRGPGMADVARCLADGYSTAGSPGTGLGAMARLASLFDVHSLPGVGTAVLARLWAGPPRDLPEEPGLTVGAVCLPVAGEEVSGDAWAAEIGEGRHLLMVADGLGHGPLAAEASREAVRCFRERLALDPAEVVQAAHAALRSTRGAALAVAEIDVARREVRFAGVGNISGTIFAPGDRPTTSLVSHNGTVGHALRKAQNFTYAWPEGAALVLHSDGLATQWKLERYAGLASRHPSLVAGVLFRDFRRSRDDVTVLVAREKGASPR